MVGTEPRAVGAVEVTGLASMALRHHSMAALLVGAPEWRTRLPWTVSALPSPQEVPEDPHLVIAGSVRDRTELLGDGVAHRVGLAVLYVDGANEQVVGDVVQVPTELEPGAGGGDMVRGALPFDLGWAGREDRLGMALEPWMRGEVP